MPDFSLTEEQFADFAENRYLLVNVASYRARQVNDGVEVYVKSKSRHPLHIALEEIYEGHIMYSFGVDEVEEEVEGPEEVFRFDDFVDLEGDFDVENEASFDFEDFDFEDFEDAEEIAD